MIRGSVAKKVEILGGDLRLSIRPTVVESSSSCQRVVALLSVFGHPVKRDTLSEKLWPDTAGKRASANLRTALWKIRSEIPDLIETDGTSLLLSHAWSIDYQQALATGLNLASQTRPELAESSMIDLFCNELLPGWCDEWLEAERRTFRELRIHALESLGTCFLGSGQIYLAIRCGLESIAIDPYRESSHRLLISAYRAEGNRMVALRHIRDYRQFIRRELNARPDRELTDLELELAGA